MDFLLAPFFAIVDFILAAPVPTIVATACVVAVIIATLAAI
jgi:hypothetical protein